MSDDPNLDFGSPLSYPFTLGTTSVQVLGVSVDRSRSAIIFHNPHPTAQVAVCPITNRRTGEALPAVVNGAGSYTILPLSELRLVGVGLTNCAWNAISDTPSTPFTVLEFYP